jgi:hypothetical protein
VKNINLSRDDIRRMNALTALVYDQAGALIQDPDHDLKKMEVGSFSTQYPGGLFGASDLFIPRDIARYWTVQGAGRVLLRNALQTVYEGYISNLPIRVEEVTQGRGIHANGAWGHILMNRRIRKPWADTRIDEANWPYYAAAPGAEKCTLDRNSRLRFTPKHEAWALNDYASIVYHAPVGETIKRVTFAFDFNEGAQNWYMGMADSAAAILWEISATSTGTQDITLATPRNWIYFYFWSGAGQTPASDGTIYAQLTDLVVYTETGTIDLTEIAKDVAAKDSRISTDFSLIGSNTLSLVPFITDDIGGYPTLADILDKAAKYGDSSFNSWAVGLRESDLSTDGKPILFVEQYPALTGYDYAVRLEEGNLTPPFEPWQDFDELYNYIIVQYLDDNGRTIYITPSDDAGLTDAASVATYGQRDYLLTPNVNSKLAVAATPGKRFLAAHKDPIWRVNGNITIKGWIRGANSQIIPACQIRAGKRIKIENWLSDVSGTGLTFLITGTTYTDADQTCQISVGNADPLDVVLAQLAMGK